MPRTASAWSACTPRSRSRTSPHKRAAHAGDHGARTRRHRPQGLRAGHRDRQGGNRQRRQRDRGPRLQEQLATGDGYSSLQMSRGKYVSPARTNRPVIRLSSNHSLQASVSTRTRRPSTAMRRPGTMDPRYCTVTASPTTGVRREGGVTVRPNRWIGALRHGHDDSLLLTAPSVSRHVGGGARHASGTSSRDLHGGAGIEPATLGL